MDGVQAVEGELNAIVKEYLQMLDYGASAGTFDDEISGKGKRVIEEALPPSQDENQLHIQKKILQAFDNGNNQVFRRLWTENIPKQLQEDGSCKRLEFNIQLYFAIFAIKGDTPDQLKIEKGLKWFKTFLETRGAALSQTTEFVAFYALPFVPSSSLKNHPSFSVLFEDSWASDLRQKLKDFLSTVLHAASLPYLYKLFTGSGDRSRTEKRQYENHIEALQQQISEHEYRATLYFKRYTKIQADYKNLINIAAELVDSLENAVRGKMVTPEYLRSICERLFSNSQNPVQSTDFARPGTAASLLRASVANTKAGLAIGGDVPYLPSLNYVKIKDDLRRLSPRKQALLLQALRLRLVKSQVGEQRDMVISGYIANDVLGCSSDLKQGETMVNLLMSKDGEVQCQTAMLFNAVASFTAGRAYIGHSEVMMKELIVTLKRTSEKTKTGENLLGAMQKLSLRRQVQSLMIDCGLVIWLIKLLEEPEVLNDYSLEYSVALLMNLCLRSTGKRQCIQDCESILQLLADLLGHENREIRPYVNGTLYSILALPTIRQRAVSMGLEEVLRCYVQEEDQDMNRQVKFIIKQINTGNKHANDSPESDNEDEEDDEEGDVLDAEFDEEEVEIAKSGELSGEQLLSAKYLGVLSSLSSSAAMDSKSLLASTAMEEDKPLTRPVTPRSHPKLSAIEELSSRGSARSDIPSQSGRPKTQSSGNAARNKEREPSSEEMPPPSSHRSSRQQKKLDPFQAKPKIPRTPDSLGSSRSRPVTGDIPPPTRSVSPPVPKPSSRGQDSINCFYECLQPCRNMKKRHFHCKICNYLSQRLDNMKRHIPYHFMKLKKERQRAPDGIKMVCHEYFTETCNVDGCSYSLKQYHHFHCTLCKFWACNIKKSYKYRLKHLNRSHSMFFTDKENPAELPDDQNVTKKIEKLRQSGRAKLLTYPAAKVDVLNSRRRAKQRRKGDEKLVGDALSTYKDEAEIDVNYFKNIGEEVKKIIQPMDDSSDDFKNLASSKDSLEISSNISTFESTRKRSFNLSLRNDKTPDELSSNAGERAFNYAVTLNGDLHSILAVLTTVKESGIVLQDPSLHEIIFQSSNFSSNEAVKSLSITPDCVGVSKYGTHDGTTIDGVQVDNPGIGGKLLSDEGFSETTDSADVSASLTHDLGIPQDASPSKGLTIETDKILEFLSKMVDCDITANDGAVSAIGIQEESTGKDRNGLIASDQNCSRISTECGRIDEEALPGDVRTSGNLQRQLRSSRSQSHKGRYGQIAVSTKRKSSVVSPKRVLRKRNKKFAERNMTTKPSEAIETCARDGMGAKEMESDDHESRICSGQTINIYDIINDVVRNQYA